MTRNMLLSSAKSELFVTEAKHHQADFTKTCCCGSHGPEGGISYQLPILSFFRETDQMTSNMLLITTPSTINIISVNTSAERLSLLARKHSWPGSRDTVHDKEDFSQQGSWRVTETVLVSTPSSAATAELFTSCD